MVWFWATPLVVFESAPLSVKRGWYLLLKWLIMVLQVLKSCYVFLPLVWRTFSAFVKPGSRKMTKVPTTTTSLLDLGPSLPLSLYLCISLLTVHYSYQTFPELKTGCQIELKGKFQLRFLAVRLRVCYWCSEIQKCSAFFSETYSVWRLCSFQAQSWLPTSDMLVTCWLLKNI